MASKEKKHMLLAFVPLFLHLPLIIQNLWPLYSASEIADAGPTLAVITGTAAYLAVDAN